MLKYSIQETNHEDWKCFIFQNVKLYVNFKANLDEYYNEYQGKESSVELDIIFNEHLAHLQNFLSDLGINYHALSQKKRALCLWIKSKQRTQIQNTIYFKFNGNLKPVTRTKAHRLLLSASKDSHLIVTLEQDKPDIAQVVLTLSFSSPAA